MIRSLPHRPVLHVHEQDAAVRTRAAERETTDRERAVDFRLSAQHFVDLLVDGDVSNNTMNWQWVAGSGADAAPYFRVFNPVTQGERFDPQGEYVRRWAPALSTPPIVDLKESRQAALDAYAEIKD